VSFVGHVAGRGFVAWSLCPTPRRCSAALPAQPRPSITDVETLDGTIKPARFLVRRREV